MGESLFATAALKINVLSVSCLCIALNKTNFPEYNTKSLLISKRLKLP